MERIIHLGENWLIFWGIWGEAVLFLGLGEQGKNTFRELRNFSFRNLGDQCIIFRDQGSTDPPPPPGGLIVGNQLQTSASVPKVLVLSYHGPRQRHLCLFDKLLV